MTWEPIFHHYASLSGKNLPEVFFLFFKGKFYGSSELMLVNFFGVVSYCDWKCGIIVLSRTLESFLFHLYPLPLCVFLFLEVIYRETSPEPAHVANLSILFSPSLLLFVLPVPKENLVFFCVSHLIRTIWRWMLFKGKKSC